MKSYEVSGITTLKAELSMAGEDMSLTVYGGHRPHIGSVSLASPRQSLTGQGTSATVSTLNLPGHMDDAVGNMFAKRLCAVTGANVCVCCGIHVDGATPEDIRAILAMAEELLKIITGDLLPAAENR